MLHRQILHWEGCFSMNILSNNQNTLNEDSYKEFKFVSRQFKQLDMDKIIEFIDLLKENQVTKRLSLANAYDQYFLVRLVYDSVTKHGQNLAHYKTTTRSLYKHLNCGKDIKNKADYKNLSIILSQFSNIKFHGNQLIGFKLKRNSHCILEIYPGLFNFAQHFFYKKVEHCIQLNSLGCSIFNSLRTCNRALAIFIEDIFLNCKKNLQNQMTARQQSILHSERKIRLQKIFMSNSKTHVIHSNEIERDGLKVLRNLFPDYNNLINAITKAALDRKDRFGATLITKYNLVKNQFSKPIANLKPDSLQPAQNQQNTFFIGEIPC